MNADPIARDDKPQQRQEMRTIVPRACVPARNASPLLRRHLRTLAVGLLCILAMAAPSPRRGLLTPAAAAEAGFVDIRSVIPDAVVDLRYATADNFVGTPLYPAGRALPGARVAGAGPRRRRRRVSGPRGEAGVLGLLSPACRAGADVRGRGARSRTRGGAARRVGAQSRSRAAPST